MGVRTVRVGVGAEDGFNVGDETTEEQTTAVVQFHGRTSSDPAS